MCRCQSRSASGTTSPRTPEAHSVACGRVCELESLRILVPRFMRKHVWQNSYPVKAAAVPGPAASQPAPPAAPAAQKLPVLVRARTCLKQSGAAVTATNQQSTAAGIENLRTQALQQGPQAYRATLCWLMTLAAAS